MDDVRGAVRTTTAKDGAGSVTVAAVSFDDGDAAHNFAGGEGEGMGHRRADSYDKPI